jgi:hypothetical protein
MHFDIQTLKPGWSGLSPCLAKYIWGYAGFELVPGGSIPGWSGLQYPCWYQCIYQGATYIPDQTWYKPPPTYLIVTYFPTYLPTYETYFLRNWLPRWNQILTRLRSMHNWVITKVVPFMTKGSLQFWSALEASFLKKTIPHTKRKYGA